MEEDEEEVVDEDEEGGDEDADDASADDEAADEEQVGLTFAIVSRLLLRILENQRNWEKGKWERVGAWYTLQ